MSYATIGCLCIALLVGVNAADESIKNRILGGDYASIIEYPYQVSIRIQTIGHYCGGAIISDKHILTAAHCVDGMINNRRLDRLMTIHTGSSLSIGRSGKVYRAEKVVVHPGWSNDKDDAYVNDIAVITLTEKIKFDGNTAKINLPAKSYTFGDSLVATGWGLNRFPSKNGMTVLQKLDMKVINNARCSMIFGHQLHKGQICAYKQRRAGVCSGDSGGPLADVKENAIVGVVSWGVPCGKGVPDVFSNVYFYKNWIKKQIEA